MSFSGPVSVGLARADQQSPTLWNQAPASILLQRTPHSCLPVVPLFLILLPIQCSKLWLCFEAFFFIMYKSSRSDHLVSVRLRLCVCVNPKPDQNAFAYLLPATRIELSTVSCSVLPLEAQHNLLCQFKYHKYAWRHAQIFFFFFFKRRHLQRGRLYD